MEAQVATIGSPCPYCNGTMELVDSIVVYKTTSYGPLYLCSNYPVCDAYVGCHPNTTKALGTPANRRLRAARKRAHDLFDPLWKQSEISRGNLYAQMQRVLMLDHTHAHIAMLDEEHCRKLCRAIKRGEFYRKTRNPQRKRRKESQRWTSP